MFIQEHQAVSELVEEVHTYFLSYRVSYRRRLVVCTVGKTIFDISYSGLKPRPWGIKRQVPYNLI